MATLENVRLDIEASASKPGHSEIRYSYELHPSEADCAARREFVVTVGLWGEDVLDDDVLATDMDEHHVRFDDMTPCEPVTVQRSFDVQTKLLDEDLVGDDEVFLIVEARTDAGAGPGAEQRASGRSNTVVGDF